MRLSRDQWQIVVLDYLAQRGPRTTVQVADHLQRGEQATTRLLLELVDAHLVEPVPAVSASAQLWRITPAGREVAGG